MATISQPLTGATTREFPQSSVRFDWMVVLLEAWWVGGLFVDGWAHAHGKVDQSFFTPWHAILYAGFFVNALFFASVAWRNHGKGYPWSRSVPRGYEFAVLGVGIFLVGGFLDLVWHLLFGIERSLSATLSPTHLMLALGHLPGSQWTLAGRLVASSNSPAGEPGSAPTHACLPGLCPLHPHVLYAVCQPHRQVLGRQANAPGDARIRSREHPPDNSYLHRSGTAGDTSLAAAVRLVYHHASPSTLCSPASWQTPARLCCLLRCWRSSMGC